MLILNSRFPLFRGRPAGIHWSDDHKTLVLFLRPSFLYSLSSLGMVFLGAVFQNDVSLFFLRGFGPEFPFYAPFPFFFPRTPLLEVELFLD